MIFSALTFAVAIPSAIKILNWLATMYKGSIGLATPMCLALVFIFLFAIGGLTGFFLGALSVNVAVHDTYFVVAHFHYVMVGGMMIAFLAGLHYWWPKITGQMYSEFWGRIASLLLFAGFNLTFFPQFILGTRGMPRRYSDYKALLVDHPEFRQLNLMSTIGAYVLAAGLVLMAVYWRIRSFAAAGAGQSLGRRDARMAVQLAAAVRQFRRHARRRRPLRLQRIGLRSGRGRLRAREAVMQPHDDDHPKFLAHHFQSHRQQFDAGKLGMWIFLLTEILLFGGLFCAYAVYRANHPDIFVYAHRFLDTNLGALNTCVLIASSLTMAWAFAAQTDQRRGLIACLALTLLCALRLSRRQGDRIPQQVARGTALGKQVRSEGGGVEGDGPADGRDCWLVERCSSRTESRAAQRALLGKPGANRRSVVARRRRRLRRPKTPSLGGIDPRRIGVFFSIYFFMTGLHAVHVIAGMAAIGWILSRALPGGLQQPLLRAGRLRRPVLAPGRYDLDLPLSASVPHSLTAGNHAHVLAADRPSVFPGPRRRHRPRHVRAHALGRVCRSDGPDGLDRGGHVGESWRLEPLDRLGHRHGEGVAGGAVLHAPPLRQSFQRFDLLHGAGLPGDFPIADADGHASVRAATSTTGSEPRGGGLHFARGFAIGDRLLCLCANRKRRRQAADSRQAAHRAVDASIASSSSGK